MYTRREFLERSLKGSSLVAVGSVLPTFVARTAMGAEPGQDPVLVVVELTGGNDGLNTVIPHADDLYQKARPKLAYGSGDVIRVDDHIGLHPSLGGLSNLLQKGQLAILQGVGYPNPNRSHFESMDVWQSGDPRGKVRSGWLARSLGHLKTRQGDIAAFHLGEQQLPLAMDGSGTAVPSVNADKPFGLHLGATSPNNPREQNTLVPKDAERDQYADHRQLVRELSSSKRKIASDSLLQFVQRTSVETYKTVDRLHELMEESRLDVPQGQYVLKGGQYRMAREGLNFQLALIARMIRAGFGTRVFYVSLDGFDTHGDQRDAHAQLLQQVGTAVGNFFNELAGNGDDRRVILMTYSEFGRRVKENGSAGTDHGAASNMFVAGPAVNGGLLGDHPSLAADELDAGDLKYHTDFRQVYATLLDKWLGCDSRQVLGEEFETIPLFKSKA